MSRSKNLQKREYTCAPKLPWRTVIQKNDPFRIHKEIEEFCTYLAPTASERAMRRDVIMRVEAVILSLWPKATIQCYGSCATDVFLPTSDIDMVIFGDVGEQTEALFMLAEQLCKGVCEVEQMLVIAQTKVPIIHFTDAKTGCGVDISLNIATGLSHTTLVHQYLDEYKPLKQLLLFLKFFLHHYALNQPYTGGIGSYGLILMIVSFLRLVQSNANAGDTASVESSPNSSKALLHVGDTTNLGDLLLGFLYFYGKEFDYCWNAITLRGDLHHIPKKDNPEWWLTPWIPVIEDPLFPENNVARTAYKIMEIKQAFLDAYVALTARIEPSVNCPDMPEHTAPILASVIYIPQELIKHRQHIAKLYRTVTVASKFKRKRVQNKSRPKPPQPKENHVNSKNFNNHSKNKRKGRTASSSAAEKKPCLVEAS